MLRQFLGAHYVGPVSDVLAPETRRRNMVLDLCTGNGKWYEKHLKIRPRSYNNIIGIDRVMDMSQEFPHAHFRGIDIGDIVFHHSVPLTQPLNQTQT